MTAGSHRPPTGPAAGLLLDPEGIFNAGRPGGQALAGVGTSAPGTGSSQQPLNPTDL